MLSDDDYKIILSDRGIFMNEETKKCPSCGEAYDDELLIVCLNCGAELHSNHSCDAPVKYGPFSAYKAMFKRAFDFRGRSSRSEYWFAYLFNALVVIMFSVAMICVDIMAAQALEESGEAAQIYVNIFRVIDYVFTVYAFVLLVPQLSLIVRRLHDSGLNGAFASLVLFGVFGMAVLMIPLARKGTSGPNRYGPPV